MKILGLSGSQREDGNTAYAVRYALEVSKNENASTKYLSVANRKITPCIGCWRCIEKGKCIFDDDMKEIEKGLRWCDGVIIGSPVYFGMVSSQLKTAMERCVVLRPSYRSQYIMSGKVGGGIACGNFRNGGQELTLQNINTFLLQINVMTVSDGPGYSHSGATIVGESKDDLLGLETIKNITKNIINSIRNKK